MSLFASQEEPGVIELEVFVMLDTNEDGFLSFEEMLPLMTTEARMDAVRAQLSRCRNPEAGLSSREFAAAFHQDPIVAVFYQNREADIEMKARGAACHPERGLARAATAAAAGTACQPDESRTRCSGFGSTTPKKARSGKKTPRSAQSEKAISAAPSWGPEDFPSLSSNQSSALKEPASWGAPPSAAQVCNGIAESHKTETAGHASTQRSRRRTAPPVYDPIAAAAAASIAAPIGKATAPELQEEGGPASKTAQRRHRRSRGGCQSPKVQAQVEVQQKTPQRGRHQSNARHEDELCQSPKMQAQVEVQQKTPQRGRRPSHGHCEDKCQSPPVAIAPSSWTSAQAARLATEAAAAAADASRIYKEAMMHRSGCVRFDLPSPRPPSPCLAPSSRTSSRGASRRSSRASSPVAPLRLSGVQPVGFEQGPAQHRPVSHAPASPLPVNPMPGGMPVGSPSYMQANVQAFHRASSRVTTMAPGSPQMPMPPGLPAYHSASMRAASVPPMPPMQVQAYPCGQATGSAMAPGSPQLPPGIDAFSSAAMRATSVPPIQSMPPQAAPPVHPMSAQAMPSIHQMPSQVPSTTYAEQVGQGGIATAAAALATTSEAFKQLENKAAALEAANRHYESENLALRNVCEQLRAAAQPEIKEAVQEALRQKRSADGVLSLSGIGSLRGLRFGSLPSGITGAKPFFTQARRQSRYPIIDPRTGEEVTAPSFRKQVEDEAFTPADVAPATPRQEAQHAEVEDQRVARPRRASQVLVDAMKNNTNGNEMPCSLSDGASWDWPLSRQEKKERSMLLHQMLLVSEIEELQETNDWLEERNEELSYFCKNDQGYSDEEQSICQ